MTDAERILKKGRNAVKTWLDQAGKPVNWEEVRGVIFDVDGTLYRQKPVRFSMMGRLMRHLLAHPCFFRELMGIYHFRKLRETASFRTRTMEAQIRAAAASAGIRDAERLKKAIQRWMFEEPLTYIRKYRNPDTLGLLAQMQSAEKKILIYSDYATEQKMEVLGIRADGIYYPGIHGIEGMKPSGKNVQRILSSQGLCPDETVYIGDRPEKDGKSARAAGVRFVSV